MSDAQFDERIYGPLNDRQLLWSVYEKLQDALNSANLPESLEGSLSAASDWVAELHWRLFDERIGLKSLAGERLEWEETVRDEFESQWPCCDVPATGWVLLDARGEVVDMSSGCFRCEHGGGLDEFIEDLKSGKALPRDC